MGEGARAHHLGFSSEEYRPDTRSGEPGPCVPAAGGRLGEYAVWFVSAFASAFVRVFVHAFVRARSSAEVTGKSLGSI